MKPTKGRIVFYYSESGAEYAAIITDVINEERGAVSLFVLAPGNPHEVERSEFSEERRPLSWAWPPRV